MADLPISITTAGLLKTAPVNWNDRANRMLERRAGIEYLPPIKDRSSISAVITELDEIIQRAARLRGYLDARYGHGCGDQGHDDGVKQSNQLVARVRKALGFSIHKATVRF